MKNKTMRSCVIEPTIFESALLSCLSKNASFSLSDLESLAFLSNCIVFFDEIFFLNCHQPSIRLEGAPKDIHEVTKDTIVDSLKWDFVNCEISMQDCDNSDEFDRLYLSRPKEEYEIIYLSKNKNIRERKKIWHPVIGKESWSSLMYLDRINNTAANLDATVIHRKSDAAKVLENLYFSRPDISLDLVEQYEAALRNRFESSKLKRYREILHYAPLLLSPAVASAGDKTPKDILKTLEQMRSEVAAQYRALCNELLYEEQSKADNILAEIESILEGLALNDKKIPSSHELAFKTIVSITKPYSILKDIFKGDEEVIQNLVNNIENMVSSEKEIRGTINIAEKNRIYRQLRIFNQLHTSKLDSSLFFDELNRVFGDLDFSKNELQRYLSGESIRNIYASRK